MKIKINKKLILEQQKLLDKGINYTADKGTKKLVEYLPVEKIIDLNDEKQMVSELGGPTRYRANNKNTWKLLGGIGGASLGAKLAMMPEYHEHFSSDPVAYGAMGLGVLGGFFGGGYLGSKLGKDFGEHLSNKVLVDLNKQRIPNGYRN